MYDVMVDDKKARIMVHVQPNASRNEALGFRDGVLHIRIAAPPIKGQANRELIKFLSDTLGVSKSNLTIEKGVTSKRKVTSIDGLTQIQVKEQFEKLGIQM